MVPNVSRVQRDVLSAHLNTFLTASCHLAILLPQSQLLSIFHHKKRKKNSHNHGCGCFFGCALPLCLQGCLLREHFNGN